MYLLNLRMEQSYLLLILFTLTVAFIWAELIDRDYRDRN
jgi:hypothetical protein